MPKIELWKPGAKYLGLVTAGGKDTGPPGSLRRAKGVQRIYDGVLRSRFGSTAHANSTSGAQFPVVFNGNLHFYKNSEFYRLGSVIRSSLGGSFPVYAKMAVNAGMPDYLFVTGAGDMFKVAADGTDTKTGIVAPNVTLTTTDSGAGSLAAGTYTYTVTFRNSVTGSVSNGNLNPKSITVGASRQVTLGNIPTSSDPQVDSRQVYRTTAGGTILFFLATIADNSTTSYIDTGGTSLSATQLQDDNTPPGNLSAWSATHVPYQDGVGPFLGRMWWCRHATFPGNIYYSPIGRPESVQGFLTVANTDEATVKLVIWNGLWIFTTKGIRQIVSTTAQPLEVRGAVGIADSANLLGFLFVQPTPAGIIYIAEDGLRIFDGSTSRLLSRQALGLYFRDQALAEDDLTGSALGESTFARDEYIVSNLSTALAYNIQEQTWRNIGLPARGLGYDTATDTVYLTTFGAGGKILQFEVDQTTDDDGDSIPFEVEFSHMRVDIIGRGLVQFIYLDIDTAERDVTPTLILDGTTVALTAISTNGRTKVEIPVLRIGRVLGLRLTGADAVGQIVIYGVSMEVYVPKGR